MLLPAIASVRLNARGCLGLRLPFHPACSRPRSFSCCTLIWLTVRHADIWGGVNGLALQVQEKLGSDPKVDRAVKQREDRRALTQRFPTRDVEAPIR